MLNNQQLINKDLSNIWHPCSQMKDYQTTLPLIPIKQGKGIWLYDFNNNKYLDAISSWWVNIFGHCNKYINNKIKEQLDSLEHVILAGFSHEPIINLSEKLINITPKNLTKCFYADNGSSGIEVAMKMSYHYWQNIGLNNKNKFVSLSNSYHGETIGALSIGNVDLYKEVYNPILINNKIITAPSPDCFYREPGETWYDYSLRKFYELDKILAEHHNDIAGIFIEPLVQCAGNMRMYHPIYLSKVREACDKYNIHLILDEIAVGFGRTGTMFACEQANIEPDFMCLSKGLTGGYLPLCITLTTEKIYSAFYDDYTNINKAFLHSHSYTGNPLACAAAIATLEIFENNNIIENNKILAKSIWDNLIELQDHKNIVELRQTGMITAFELAQDKKNKILYPWQERRGIKVYNYCLENNILLRPLGNTIYIMTPYVITLEEIEFLTKHIKKAVDIATKY